MDEVSVPLTICKINTSVSHAGELLESLTVNGRNDFLSDSGAERRRTSSVVDREVAGLLSITGSDVNKLDGELKTTAADRSRRIRLLSFCGSRMLL